MFEFWDWVGGRYSYDSAIGLSLMIAIGHEQFAEMLAGFRSIDEHFRTAPFERNLPVLLGLIGIWYDDFFGAETQAILPVQPVPRALPRVPAAARHGEQRQVGRPRTATRSPCRPGPIVWGQPGTNGQHAFYQLIHQGTKLVPADFIGFVHANHEVGDHQNLLMANLLRADRGARVRQDAREVSRGVPATRCRTATSPATTRPTRSSSSGSRPYTLGQLVAIYEHKVFTQGTIWNINSFDQWGVELGKKLATAIIPELDGDGTDPDLAHDSSTNALHPPVPPAPELRR